MNYIKVIFYVYFTYFPHLLFNHAQDIGNLGLAGIYLRLIHAQYLFWISTLLLLLFSYNIFIILLCMYLYILSLYKIYISRLYF
jgi:hypothetical protein